jgi:triosephosphate isomerase
MRRPFYFAAWKSNKTMKEVEQFYTDVMQRNLQLPKGAEVVLAPAYVFFDMSKSKMPAPLQLGAQDVCETDGGGRMGEISARTMKEFGVKYCMIGNLEKRDRGETSSIINKKIKTLFANGITPVLCVGENLQEYESNTTKEVLRMQIQGALADVNNVNDIVICYRPGWTIGTGYNATSDFCNIVAKYIREVVVQMKDNPLDGSFPVLYGGGVSKSNVVEYMKQSDIDGVFFVASALNIDDFCGVINGK